MPHPVPDSSRKFMRRMMRAKCVLRGLVGKSTIRFRFIRSVQGFMTSTRLSKISNRAEVPELGVFKRQKVRIFQLTALVLAGRRKGDSRAAKRFSPEIVERIHRLFDDERVV